MIIKEDDVVITHFGIRGMRWGVRKEAFKSKEKKLREKALNVLSNKNEFSNKNDMQAAEWMSKPLPEKAAVVALNAGIKLGVAYGLRKAFNLPGPAISLKDLKKTAVDTTLDIVSREAHGRSSLKRYEQSGKQNLSKKQYKKMTPESIMLNTVSVGRVAYAAYSSFASTKVSESKNRAAIGKSFVYKNYLDQQNFGPRTNRGVNIKDAFSFPPDYLLRLNHP